jgi:hypothetical protein
MTSDLFWGDEDSLTDGVPSLVKKMSCEYTEVTKSNRGRVGEIVDFRLLIAD